MDTLIGFIMDNILYVIIAAGFLVSALGKSGKRPARMPDFGGGRDAVPQPNTAVPPIRRDGPGRAGGAAAESMTEPYPAQQPYAAAVFRESAAERSTPADAGDPYAVSRSRQARPAPKAPPAAGITADVGADQLRQAVVWAEILGPPRARSPLSRRK